MFTKGGRNESKQDPKAQCALRRDSCFRGARNFEVFQVNFDHKRDISVSFTGILWFSIRIFGNIAGDRVGHTNSTGIYWASFVVACPCRNTRPDQISGDLGGQECWAPIPCLPTHI